MAQRKYEQFQETLEKGLVTIHGNIPIGATGAVGTLDPKKNQGILSVVRNSAGNYTITLGNSAQSAVDKYQRLVNAQVVLSLATVTATVMQVQVTSDLVLSAGTVTFQCIGPTSSSVTTPIAVDPDNGAILLVSLVLKNSTV